MELLVLSLVLRYQKGSRRRAEFLFLGKELLSIETQKYVEALESISNRFMLKSSQIKDDLFKPRNESINCENSLINRSNSITYLSGSQ